MLWLSMRLLKSGTVKAREKAARELWQEPDPRALTGLAAAALTDEDVTVRRVATSALGRLQVPERLDPLMQVLDDREPDVIQSALLCLRGVKDDRVIPRLLPLLRHRDFHVRTGAGQTIDAFRWAPPNREQRVWFCVAKGWFSRAAELGADAIPALKLTVETSPVFVAIRAVEALGKIHDPAVVKLLCEVLHSPEPAVGIAATDAISKVGGSGAVAALMTCLKSTHTQLRSESARALGILGATEASVPISQMLEDKEWEVRREAASALGKLKNPETLEPLTKLLDDVDSDVREAAASALGKMRDRRAVGPLVMALKDEYGAVRRIASAGLARIDPDWISLPETRAAVEKLKLAIQDADPAVRFFVAQLFVNMGEMSAEDLLGFSPADQLATPATKRRRMASSIFIALLEDRDRDVRQAAAEALGQLGGEKAKHALTRAGNEPDGDVAAAIQMALQAIAAEPPT
jgi:HEAT repeat protein